MDIKPLTLQEYAKKRNESTQRYGNKPRPPHTWQDNYKYYLENLKANDPTTLLVYHGIKEKVASYLDNIADALEKMGYVKEAFEADNVSDTLERIIDHVI